MCLEPKIETSQPDFSQARLAPRKTGNQRIRLEPSQMTQGACCVTLFCSLRTRAAFAIVLERTCATCDVRKKKKKKKKKKNAPFRTSWDSVGLRGTPWDSVGLRASGLRTRTSPWRSSRLGTQARGSSRVGRVGRVGGVGGVGRVVGFRLGPDTGHWARPLEDHLTGTSDLSAFGAGRLHVAARGCRLPKYLSNLTSQLATHPILKQPSPGVRYGTMTSYGTK